MAERRARLGLRHRLAVSARASDPADVARSLVAVHSTDPSSVYLGILARMAGGDIADVERALYADRTLIRLLGMRRTVFVTTVGLAPVVQAACSDAVAASERRKLLGWLADADVGPDVAGWLAGAEHAALEALTARGQATAAELAATDPRLAVQLGLGQGTSSARRFNVASRVLLVLAAGQDRPRPTGRHVDVAPVLVDAAGRVVPWWPGRMGGTRCRSGAGPAVAARLRPGDLRRPPVVGWLDQDAGAPGAGAAAAGRG